jgi:hypothetical protein
MTTVMIWTRGSLDPRSAICYLLSVFCCLLSTVCFLLFAACCLLSAFCCQLPDACYLLSAVLCLPHVFVFSNILSQCMNAICRKHVLPCWFSVGIHQKIKNSTATQAKESKGSVLSLFEMCVLQLGLHYHAVQVPGLLPEGEQHCHCTDTIMTLHCH